MARRRQAQGQLDLFSMPSVSKAARSGKRSTGRAKKASAGRSGG